MAASQPFSVALQGGLDKASNTMELLQKPGVATRLSNFEVSNRGGYRRINGYTQFGDGTRPNSSNAISGIFVYADGVIACSGTDIFFSQDGNSWLQINRDSVSGSGDNYSTFTGRSTLTRTSQSKASFALFEGNTDYGEVVIVDESSATKPFLFKMTGTGSALSSRTYFAEEITVSGTHYPKYCVIHDKHLVVAGASTAKNTVFYSGTSDINDFTSSGSGSIVLDDQVVGLKSFRNELFLFCRNSIYKLQNINNSSTISIVPITQNVGCMDGASIQEIAGDLVFLSPDGLRTIAGTTRIGDVELGSVSRAIQAIIGDIALEIDEFIISSAVLRSKSQYRLFYSKATASSVTSKGVIGTITPNGFEWSETEGIQAHALTSGLDKDGLEQTYHGDKDGYVYNHDDGNSFNPAGTSSNIAAMYETPYFDFGDAGTRKTLNYTKISVTPEGECQPSLKVSFNYGDTAIPQPANYTLDSIQLPSLFGTSKFNQVTFGASNDPMVRQAIQGSGDTCSFRIFSTDTNAPYAINGIYVDYRPSGRR